MANLSSLMQDVSAELGLARLPLEEQQKILQKVGDIVFQRVMMRVIDELDEPAKIELDKLIEAKKNDVEAVLNFLRGRLPNFDAVVMEEVAGFKKETVELLQAAKGK